MPLGFELREKFGSEWDVVGFECGFGTLDTHAQLGDIENGLVAKGLPKCFGQLSGTRKAIERLLGEALVDNLADCRGIVGFSSETGGGKRLSTACMVSSYVGQAKGLRPVRDSYRITPSAKMSEAGVISFIWTCSGDMYWKVPFCPVTVWSQPGKRRQNR